MPDDLGSLLVPGSTVPVFDLSKTREYEIYTDALVLFRNEKYVQGISLLEQIPEGTDYYDDAQKLLQQIKTHLAAHSEREIRGLIGKIETVYNNRRFELAKDLLKSAREYLKILPRSDNLDWSVDLKIWDDHIQVGSEIWSKYSQAKTYLREASENSHTDRLPDAMRLLDEVIGCPEHDEMIDFIRGEAEKAQQQIFLRGLEEPCDLMTVRQKLISLMRAKPTDQTLLQQYKLFQAMQFFEDALQQSKTIPQKMKERDDEIVNELKQNSEDVRREARGWFWTSLFFAALAIGIFLYGILILFRVRETLDYLTPLYTLIPGMLTLVFFKQYNLANRRMDKEIKDMREQIAQHDKLAVEEFKKLEEQIWQEIQIVDSTREQILVESDKIITQK